MTLSALLNIFDGLIAPDGLMTIATTNHPERLDPALMRLGRFDMLIELGPLGVEEHVRMAGLLDAEPDPALLADFRPMSGAEMRQELIGA